MSQFQNLERLLKFKNKQINKFLIMQQSIPSQTLFNFECAYKNKANFLCCTANCMNSAFLCSDLNCQCFTTLHFKCNLNLMKPFLNTLRSKKTTPSPQTIKYIQKVINLYEQTIDSLSQDKEEILRKMKYYGLKPEEAKFMWSIDEQIFTQINGDFINKVKIEMGDDENLERRIIITQKQIKYFEECRQKTLNLLTQQLKKLTKYQEVAKTWNIPKGVKIQSSYIIYNWDQVVKFFDRKVSSISLLYRASENDFQASKFHQKCDGKSDTVTLVQTQYGHIIGGYTPFAWTSFSSPEIINPLLKDPRSSQTFLFSITNNAKYVHITQNRKAIQCHIQFGPIFGKDLRIGDRANVNQCSANFPSDYNNHELKQNNQKSYKSFVGSESGCKFKAKQWEVFQFVFDKI